MADYNVALGVQVPDAMKSISGMLNFAQQAQNLQSSRQEFERGGVGLERERALLKPAIEAGTAAASTATTGATAARFKLQGEQQAAALRVIGGLNGDPRIKSNDPDQIMEAIIGARDQMIQNGVPKAAAEWQASQLISRAHQPGAVPQLIQTAIRQNASAGEQAGVVNAPLQLLNTGAGFQPIQTQPGAPGGLQPGGQPIPAELPLGERQTVGTNPVTASPQVTQKDAQGNVMGVFQPPTGAAPAAAAPGAPPLGPRVPQFNPGEPLRMPALVAHQEAALSALSGAPDQHQNIRGILDEIKNVSATGTAGPFWQRFNSIIGSSGLVDATFKGLDFTTPQAKADSYDLVGKYLERVASQAAQVMGPHTNAGLESAKAQFGSTGYNPGAIAKIAKLTDATVTGMEAYQPGLEKAVAAAGNRGVLAIPAYQQAWGQNYDPRIPMLANAKKAGDREEYDAIMKSLGGPRSVAFQDLTRKAQNLDRLSTQGRL